ncbi:MAG: alpha/beta hydrolase, partial [Alphaproteobacteria bacterium]|nr:alpha/beta hydrolase [Alphaproteobacteria bacterium]
VLLHGWPETWFEWRHVMPAIAERHPVIAPDLRGLGDSSRPAHGYDKRTVADDIHRLLRDRLGLERWHLAGHDWGGPTAFALAAAHAESALSLTVIDVVIPGDGGEFSQGGRRWHHAFHRTPDLPEALVGGRERTYLGWFYRAYSARPNAIDEEAVEEYLRTYSQPEALRAGFAYYRNLPRDTADNAALLATGFRLPMPVLAIGGGRTDAFGRAGEVEASMRRVATDVRGLIAEGSGHFVPEEDPELVARAILEQVARCG